MDLNINERLIQFFDSLKEPYRQIEKRLNLANGTIGKLKKGGSIGIDKLERIASTYKELNANWVLRGTEPMLLSSSKTTPEVPPLSHDKNALEMIRELSAENALLKKELEEQKS